ncbi:MAG: threonine-phosphate decarboxylase [Lachnospiraceae bacterium]|nr:threonine-phosphate decarboxylase [Lachnospiraceae bacterium]
METGQIQEQVQEEKEQFHPQLLHGGDIYGAAKEAGCGEREILDFSANINPLGLQPQVRKAILEGMERVEQYPDPLCRRLVQAIAKQEQVCPEQVLCGSGGADLIYRYVYARRPGKALLPAPTFGEYEEALCQVGAELVYYEQNREAQKGAGMLEALGPDMDVVFFCNPNNPTGLLRDREWILQLVEKAAVQGTMVFLDECFLDFSEAEEQTTLKGDLEKFPNLILLKSFTKMYAIPGLRLGYVLSDNRELLEEMRRAGQPWAVGGLAQEAGLAALKDREFPVQTRQLVGRERAFLKGQLEKMGLQVYDGAANYLCFRAPGESRLYEKLLEQGILIRRCANYRGLDGEHYRVAVRRREENRRLLKALAQVRIGPLGEGIPEEAGQ